MRRLYIPDTHLPMTNMKMLAEIHKFNKSFKATEVYQLGDFVDFYCYSRFTKDPEAPGATEEHRETTDQLRQIGSWFPNLRILWGNHEKRILKRAKEAGIPKFWLKDILTTLKAPKGMQYLASDHLNIGDNITICHGHLASSAAAMAHLNYYGTNIIHGHLHNQLGIVFNGKTQKKLWGVSASCVVDKNSFAMSYGEAEYKNIVCGFAYTDGNKPHVECLG